MAESVDHFGPGIASDCARVRARSRFLTILHEVCPNVLEELRTMWTSNRFKVRFSSMRQDWVAANEEVTLGSSDWLVPLPTDENDLRGILDFARAHSSASARFIDRALRKWAKDYRLHEDWVIESAIATMSAWEADPEHDELTWVPPTTGIWTPISMEEMEFTFKLPRAWDIRHVTRNAARTRIATAFKVQLEEWLDSTEALAREHGFPKLQQKRKLDQHLTWLVRYQVGEKTYPQIARGDGLPKPGSSGRRTVESGVGSAAKQVGLTLRPSDLPGPAPAVSRDR